MGKVFDFIDASNDILSERGVQLPLGEQATTTPATRAGKGRAVREQITGTDRTEATYASAADDELHFQQFLSANCFGDYYTRGGIDLRTRQLLTFAMLASVGGCDPQVKGHMAANLNVGNGRQMLISVTTALLPFIGYPRTLNALPPSTRSRPHPGKDNDMTARNWLITGVSSGFGRELATQLLDRGDTVVGTVRRPDSVTDLTRTYPGTFHRELLDVTDTTAIRDVVDRSFESLGRIDVVVSNAG